MKKLDVVNPPVKNHGEKKGFFALLLESIRKSNDGCGPGCGCHAADGKKANDCKVEVGGKKK
jgi:hypothetical protein